MQYRSLGNTGHSLSFVGFGGIVVSNEEQSTADAMVKCAVEMGINYFDVAPSYGDAELKLGHALLPYRDEVFLAGKTVKRDRDGAAEELQATLRNLQTPYLDLYQFHGVTRMEEVEQIFAPGGAMKAVLAARDAGQVHHIGFSCHSEEAALAMLDNFPFETVLFPFNWVCWLQGQFGPRLVSRAQEMGTGLLALKSMAWRAWAEGEEHVWPKCWYRPIDDPAVAALAVRFTLSLPITAALPPGHAELLWQCCEIAESFTPLNDAEMEQLRLRSKGIEPLFRG